MCYNRDETLFDHQIPADTRVQGPMRLKFGQNHHQTNHRRTDACISTIHDTRYTIRATETHDGCTRTFYVLCSMFYETGGNTCPNVAPEEVLCNASFDAFGAKFGTIPTRRSLRMYTHRSHQYITSYHTIHTHDGPCAPSAVQRGGAGGRIPSSGAKACRVSGAFGAGWAVEAGG
jgi:hypothetical protein